MNFGQCIWYYGTLIKLGKLLKSGFLEIQVKNLKLNISKLPQFLVCSIQFIRPSQILNKLAIRDVTKPRYATNSVTNCHLITFSTYLLTE